MSRTQKTLSPLPQNAVQILGKGAVVSPSARINAEILILEDGVVIEDHVTLDAKFVRIGAHSRIGARTQISGLGGPAHQIEMGRCSLLGSDSQVRLSRLAVGDFTKIHNHALLNGSSSLTLGHNSWVGQNCVLNCEEELWIGNGVGIGAYSSVYTHGFFGDLLLGCQIFKKAPVRIEDDVWILGSYNVISPGTTLGEKSTVLTGSIVTGSVAASSVVGGAPAKDLSQKIVGYKAIGREEKRQLLSGFLNEYCNLRYPREFHSDGVTWLVTKPGVSLSFVISESFATPAATQAKGQILVFSLGADTPKQVLDGQTFFDVERRLYFGSGHAEERALINFLVSYRARFVPAESPRVSLTDDPRTWLETAVSR